jgi:DNA-binding XRE family transcriptional regulator
MAKRAFNAAYLEISEVTVDHGRLRVIFGNGDRVDFTTAELVPSRLRTAIDWTRAQVNGTRTVILVPADPSDVEIPSTRLRLRSDSAFAKHVSKIAEDQARLLGRRLKALRESRALTQKAVATAANVEPANLSRIESGRFDVSSTTLWKILAAMDCSLDDLSEKTGPGQGSRAGQEATKGATA